MKEGEICKPSGKGLFLPLTRHETEWHNAWRAAHYGIAMLFCFLGVSLIADTFMASIEAITSRRRRVTLKDGRVRTAKIWNETVANLSLMALGSSAPEIFLSVIELFKRDMHTGMLGPSTIVGSAAFNLLVIVAVCILVIPSSEVRLIKALPVFYITAIFSVGAYMWLVFILIFYTPEIVDIGEAVITFLMLPTLIWISYLVDIGKLRMPHFWKSRVEEPSKKACRTPCLSFACESLVVPGTDGTHVCDVVVMREGDCREGAKCSYRTERLTAVPNYDYAELQGVVDFPVGISERSIRLEILPKRAYKIRNSFIVILEEPVGKIRFDPESDGGEDEAIMTVTIEAVKSVAGPGPGFLRCLDWLFNIDACRHGGADWVDQFWDAFCPDEGEREQRMIIWALHLVALPWKLVFAFVPPPSLFHGWFCFYAALFLIGFVTAIISDLAELFGCLMGLPDILTAITFVALGTSMPDLFASLVAAKNDPTADASIVNVTGSNSVNVFLGIGLPWTIGSIYWVVNGRDQVWEDRYKSIADQIDGNGAVFVVQSKNLGFTVLVFSGCAFVAIFVLLLRRHAIGAELGGPLVLKISAGILFIGLWLGYVGIASWRVLRWGEAGVQEQLLAIGTFLLIEGLLTFVSVSLLLHHTLCKKRRQHDGDSESPDNSMDDSLPNSVEQDKRPRDRRLSTSSNENFQEATSPKKRWSIHEKRERPSANTKVSFPRSAAVTDSNSEVVPGEVSTLKLPAMCELLGRAGASQEALPDLRCSR